MLTKFDSLMFFTHHRRPFSTKRYMQEPTLVTVVSCVALSTLAAVASLSVRTGASISTRSTDRAFINVLEKMQYLNHDLFAL